jgi:hypothetical protein
MPRWCSTLARISTPEGHDITLEEAGAPYTVVRVHFAPRILSVSLAKSPS